MSVVVTRPARDARRWVDGLRARGVAAEALPLLAIAVPPDGTALRRARDSLSTYAAAMFVSANAVEGFLAGGQAWPEGTRAWAPGPGTEAALRAHGVPASAIAAPAADAAQFDSESLWSVVAGHLVAGDRLLLVRGADAAGRSSGREWLAGQLVDAGVQVDVVSAYARTVPQWSAAQRQLALSCLGADSLWLFSSSEAAGNLRTLLPQADFGRARALATHPRIAQAVHALGFAEVRACRPAFEEVLTSIESFR